MFLLRCAALHVHTRPASSRTHAERETLSQVSGRMYVQGDCLPWAVGEEREHCQASREIRGSELQLRLFVGCLASQQHASVSQRRTYSDNFTCCHTGIEVADRTFHLTQSHYTDTRPASPSTDPITPGAWQGSRWSANFEVTGMTRPRTLKKTEDFAQWTAATLRGFAILSYYEYESKQSLNWKCVCTYVFHLIKSQ